MANFNIDYLVVAGGGGSAYGAGGAGGYLTNIGGTSISLEKAITYTVTVGAGGVSRPGAGQPGGNGGPSEFSGTGITTITAAGGGGGNDAGAGVSGGSGGGGGYTGGGGGAGNTPSTTPSQGNAGGNGVGGGNYAGGGGGGAFAAGENGTSGSASGSNGGDGLENNITGTPTYYAGGGGAFQEFNGTFPATTGGQGGGGAGGLSGTPGTDGLGGGAGGFVSTGGSGVVILRYATADANYTTTGSTPTEDTTTIPGQTILSFTTVGTGTITFTALPPPPPTPFDGTRATTPVTGFNKTSTSEGLKLPSGTNTNQPIGAFAEQGMIRNDTEETVDSSASAMTHYNGTNWQYFAATESPDDPNLKMNLDASNTASYPGTGTTWFDLTPNGNNGAITSANFVNSSSPYYFNFGSGKYVTTTYSLPTSGGVSIELWFNANSGVSSYMAGNNNASNALRNGIIIGDLTGSFPNESITFYQSTGLSTGADYVIFAVEEGNTKYQDGAWHQLLLIDTGSGHEVYVDGASKTLTYEPAAGGPGTRINWTNFSLSKVNWTTGGYMNGSIGQCSIYEKALTQSEVLASFNSTRSTYGI
jgi:hypothetical protein